MKLYKISFQNIKKSLKDYAIYFFTLILSVAIFYVFNALDSQAVLLDVSNSTHDIIKLLGEILSAISVFIAFVLGFLIIYASRFLIKRRNKEFGVYMTLGMSKKSISKILLTETLIIGIISLVVGLGIGVAFSQLMSVFVANMFEAKMTKFAFTFSVSAMYKTIIYFVIIYVVVMIFNTILVSKCKLIDLLHASKKSEKIKMKNPIICTIVFVIASTMLGYAYYLVTSGVEDMQTAQEILFPIVLGCISTFLIFWSLSGLLLKIISSMKGIYYKGLNSFVLRQISSKINTTVFSMTIICLMLFSTICILSTAVSLKNSMTANLTTLAPVDVHISKEKDLTLEGEEAVYNQGSHVGIEDSFHSKGFDINKNFKNITKFKTYSTEDFTLQTFFKSTYKELKEKYPFMKFDSKETIITISDYNKLAKLYGRETFKLSDDEYIIIADYDAFLELRNNELKNNTSILLSGMSLKPKYKEVKDGIIEIGANPTNMGVFIIPDSIDLSNFDIVEHISANYDAKDDEGRANIEKQISKASEKLYSDYHLFGINTKIDIYEAAIGLGAMVTFIGLYLGVIFLITSAAILALKELSESTDNKERYNMLRKLGTDEKEINRALRKQIVIFFMFPLLLAIIHSIFGLKFCQSILIIFGEEKLISSIIMTAIFIIFIYGGYLLITYFSSKQIIKENR